MKKKGKGKERQRWIQKEPEEHSSVKSKYGNQSCGQKKIVLAGPQENEARKAFRKVISSDFIPYKGREKDQQGKSKKGAYPQSGLSASETPSDERYGHAWESDDWSSSHWPDDSLTSAAGWSCTGAHTAWMAAVPLNLTNHPTRVVLDLGCTRSIGSRAAIKRFQKHELY